VAKQRKTDSSAPLAAPNDAHLESPAIEKESNVGDPVSQNGHNNEERQVENKGEQAAQNDMGKELAFGSGQMDLRYILLHKLQRLESMNPDAIDVWMTRVYNCASSFASTIKAFTEMAPFGRARLVQDAKGLLEQIYKRVFGDDWRDLAAELIQINKLQNEYFLRALASAAAFEMVFAQKLPFDSEEELSEALLHYGPAASEILSKFGMLYYPSKVSLRSTLTCECSAPACNRKGVFEASYHPSNRVDESREQR
jgi:hypothetical protein